MDFSKITIGGLLLPFKIYFQPGRFADEIADLAPDLPRNYSLWKARHKFHDPEFRHGLLTVILQFCLAQGWCFVLASLFSFLGFKIDWGGVAFGVAFGVALGVAYGVAFGVAFGVMRGVVEGVAFGVAFGVAEGVAVGVAVGVAFGVAFGVAVGVAGGVVEGVVEGVAFGVAVGVAFGVAFGVAVGVAVGVTLSLLVSHLWIYPIQFCISGLSWLISRVAPEPLLQILWRLSPVRWDEIIIFPLPGLSKLLVNLYLCRLYYHTSNLCNCLCFVYLCIELFRSELIII